MLAPRIRGKYRDGPHFRLAGHASRSGDGGVRSGSIRGKQIRGTRFIRRRAAYIEAKPFG
jgi:hypothetical protein